MSPRWLRWPQGALWSAQPCLLLSVPAERVHAAAPGGSAGTHAHHQCPAAARSCSQRAHRGKCCCPGKRCHGKTPREACSRHPHILCTIVSPKHPKTSSFPSHLDILLPRCLFSNRKCKHFILYFTFFFSNSLAVPTLLPANVQLLFRMF